MALQSIHALNCRVTSHILRIRNRRKNNYSLPFIGTIQFGSVYFYVIIPLIVMIVTNTVNQLGGLNGLETICPAIVILGLMAVSPSYILMVGPLIFWLILAYFNFQGKIFVGNSGSFAIGMTIASFAVISDLKLSLLVSILPYIFNSAIILLTIFFIRKKAKVNFDGKKLSSDHRRSLITVITYHRPLTEEQVVAIISLIVGIFHLIRRSNSIVTNYARNLSSFVKPIISSKLKPKASKTWSKVECK